MTRRTNARLAGFMFLFYIATAFAGMVLFDQATGGEGTTAKLASIAQHTPRLRLAAVLTVVTILDALVLAVALYALTRDCDADLALLALSCRVAEGVTNAIPVIAMMALMAEKAAAGRGRRREKKLESTRSDQTAGMAERASTPLSVCLSDPPGRDEAVAQEGAQNSVKEGSPF